MNTQDDYDCDDYYDDIPDGYVVCDRCNGDGEIDCRCGGDFCVCGWGEVDCPVCLHTGYISKERAEKRAAAHRELMKALWGDKANG